MTSSTAKDASPPPDSAPATAAGTLSEDDRRLAQLGYQATFTRTMTLWENFSLGFTYLSPVVGIYTLFAFALATAGPPMIWSLILVGVGQFLVVLVFSEVVSQFPLAGGVYPWARRLWGKRWAWMTGWVYAWALLITIAAVTFGAAPFIAALLGIEASANVNILLTLGLIGLVTLANLGGTKVLARLAFFGFAAELVGALVVGGWLLLTERHQPFSALFDSFGTGGDGSYLPAFLAGALVGLYLYFGFEACGDVAEEVPDPGRRIPKAMRMTIYIGGAAATFLTLALVLSVVDIGAVISGADADPVGTVLNAAFGSTGSKIVLGVVLISFASCAMSLQAAASRLIYSYARDNMIFGSRALTKVSKVSHTPLLALALAAAVPAVVVLLSKVSDSALVRIISFASFGIYLAFQMVVLAALRARLKGWQPAGPYRLAAWGLPVNIAALAYGVGGMLNLAWPRTPDAPWYDNWIVLLSGVVVVGVGLVYLLVGRPHDRGQAPAGDAIPPSA